MKLHYLTLWIALSELIVCAYGSSLRVRRMSSTDEVLRSHRRRSISLANMPGSAMQTVPADTVEWSLRHQACHAKEIIQNITQPGCEQKPIQNRMCYGVCATFHMPAVPGSEQMEMCTKCQPSGPRRQISVTLKCTGGSTKTVTVTVVDRCRCSPCNIPVG